MWYLRTLAIVFSLLICMPAQAASVVQFAGDQVCKGINRSDSLAPTDIPDGAVWAPFIQCNGDSNTTHYKIVAGVLTYIPSGFTAPFYDQPNPTGALQAVQNDTTNIPPETQIALGTYGWLILQYPNNPAGVQQYWAGLKQAFASTWLPAPVASAVETDCATANVTLNPAH